MHLAKAVERSIRALPEFPSQNILSGSQEGELLHSATKFSGRGIIELQLLMVNHGFVPLHPIIIVHVEIKQQIHRAILKRGDAHILQGCNSILQPQTTKINKYIDGKWKTQIRKQNGKT